MYNNSTCSSKSGIGNGAAYTTRETCVAASDCGIDSDEPCKWMAGVPFTENGYRNSSPDDCTAAAGIWDNTNGCSDTNYETETECINQGTIEQRRGVCIIPGTNIRIEYGREQSKVLVKRQQIHGYQPIVKANQHLLVHIPLKKHVNVVEDHLV